ncbi:uncharacterized protein BJX67DRAFT_223032 [Aspergillus lucknowensis]|uniref:Uncharacterized protein n=1 Tax=Aspergillus lucknowensis TaxID=176173 RepID=A0ABR4LLM2_9EURO
MSLVKTVQVADKAQLDIDVPENENAHCSAYYPGTPDDPDTSGLSGCAIIFNHPPSEAFEGDDIQPAVGSCPDVIEQSCIDALARQVQELVDDSASGDICGDLRQLGERISTSVATSLGKGTDWQTLVLSLFRGMDISPTRLQ